MAAEVYGLEFRDGVLFSYTVTTQRHDVGVQEVYSVVRGLFFTPGTRKIRATMRKVRRDLTRLIEEIHAQHGESIDVTDPVMAPEGEAETVLYVPTTLSTRAYARKLEMMLMRPATRVVARSPSPDAALAEALNTWRLKSAYAHSPLSD